MHIWHLIQEDDCAALGPSNVKEESQVILQHFSEYNYVELCLRDKILALVKEINSKKKEAKAESKHLSVAQRRREKA